MRVTLLVDVSVTRWYHCISRYVRRATSLGEGAAGRTGDRKEWIELRLRELGSIVAGKAKSANGFRVGSYV